MSNNIKSLLPMEPRPNTVVPGSAPAGKQAGSGRDAPVAGPVQDKVTLTEAARKLASLSAEVAQGWPMDEAKVKQLRAAIESGQYQADPVAIAAALMRFEQEG
jgi:flagellar biosynthesis anti-sigma factor FlgM